jgi:hypothetical protein
MRGEHNATSVGCPGEDRLEAEDILDYENIYQFSVSLEPYILAFGGGMNSTCAIGSHTL